MTYDELLGYCLSKPGAWQDQPWEEGDLVVKVGEKIFAFLGNTTVGLKCGDGRDEADIWLLRHPDDVTVMAYIGRHGWNTIRFNGVIPDREIREAIDDSYLNVVSRLPRKRRPQGWDT